MSNIEFTNEDIINNDCSYKDRNTVNDTIFNSKTSKSESIIHTPSPLVLEKMESMRIFFKRNDMPFVVFPISNKSICVRNNKEVDDPNKRILYKSIIETLNIYRKGNKIYDPNALAYNFDEANIEKVNEFWVPSNDVHIEQWKSGAPFTQNKCLNKFIKYCESQTKKMKTVIDVGAWCGTWAKAIEPFAKKVIAFEPDKTHFECLQRNCIINCTPRMEAVGAQLQEISLTEDNFTQAKRVNERGNIRMITLDHMAYEDVDMIKIDVEGYEMEVLKGATKTLESVQYLMIELNNNTKKYGSNNIVVEKFIGDLGFKVLMEHWPDKVFYRA